MDEWSRRLQSEAENAVYKSLNFVVGRGLSYERDYCQRLESSHNYDAQYEFNWGKTLREIIDKVIQSHRQPVGCTAHVYLCCPPSRYTLSIVVYVK